MLIAQRVASLARPVLGIPEKLLPWVLKVDPRWHPQRQLLYVRAELEHNPEGIRIIEDIIAFMLQFRSWSDTRWGGAA